MKKNKLGFTLLELLIAVTIFSITVIALYSSFYVGIRVLRRSENAMKLHQDLRLAMDEVSLDLRNSLLCPLEEEVKESPQTEEEEKSIYFFLGDDKKFTFVTLKDVFVPGAKSKREIHNVTYNFKSDNGGALVRIAKSQSRGFSTRPDGEEVLLTGVADMEVRYSFQGEEDSQPIWLNRWEEEERIPLGVKIKFRLKGMGALREFTKTVFIPVGTLGTLEEGQGL